MTIQELQERCLEQARAKGWMLNEVPVPEQIALCHSELSEGLECFRESQPLSWTDDEGKPQGLASEYADVLIRIGHYASLMGINLEFELERKLKYNMTRPYRHGGKVI